MQSKNGVTPVILQFSTLTPLLFQQKSSEFITESFMVRLEQFLQALTLFILQLIMSILSQYHIEALEFASNMVLYNVTLWQCHIVYFRIILESSIVILRHSLKALSPCSIPS